MDKITHILTIHDDPRHEGGIKVNLKNLFEVKDEFKKFILRKLNIYDSKLRIMLSKK